MDQWEENLGCLDVNLTDDALTRLDDVSKVELGFPYAFLETDIVQDVIFGGSVHSIDLPAKNARF